MMGGLRYAIHSEALKATMWHVFVFMFFANSFWGLLPLIAKDEMSGGAEFFGLLMGAVGAGAVIGAFFVNRLRTSLCANQIILLGSLATASLNLSLSFTSSKSLALVICFDFGIAWIFVLSTVNVSAQLALPKWVRARGLAVFLMVFYGAMSLGTSFWG